MSDVPPLPPQSIEELIAAGGAFASVLAEAKRHPPAHDLNWYPYDSMASIRHLKLCIQDRYPEFLRALGSGHLLDIGCADGDLSFFFASLGMHVTAVDNRPTNYNWMAGIYALRDRLDYPIDIVERDMDAEWIVAEKDFGLTLLLGILYHLKNPYYVLESLAKQSRYCLLSTRIAVVTPKGTKIESEPLAYLLERGEANADQSNYWIFSPSGLNTLVRRSGWKVLGRAVVGESKKRPEPVRTDRDAREFLFLRSTRLSLPAEITRRNGWGAQEEQEWAWTLKRFDLTVKLLKNERARSFSLGFRIPEALAAQSGVAVSCSANGLDLGRHRYEGAGEFTYEARLPSSVAQDAPILFAFVVEHQFQPAPPETRDLGVIVSLRREIFGVSEPIPFYLD